MYLCKCITREGFSKVFLFIITMEYDVVCLGMQEIHFYWCENITFIYHWLRKAILLTEFDLTLYISILNYVHNILVFVYVWIYIIQIQI